MEEAGEEDEEPSNRAEDRVLLAISTCCCSSWLEENRMVRLVNLSWCVDIFYPCGEPAWDGTRTALEF